MARLEIELKFAAPASLDPAALGAAPRGAHRERDYYFNAPDRDFALTNEAFRIREIDGTCRFTYKGPRQAGLAKTREEIELPIAGSLDDAVRLVKALGYRFVAVVEKQRSEWALTRGGFELTLCEDDVTTVGRFVEVEIVADSAVKSDAEKVLLAVCGEMGLSTAEPRSYLRMLLEKS